MTVLTLAPDISSPRRPQVSWIRQRDLHILTVGIFTYTSDDRFKVGSILGVLSSFMFSSSNVFFLSFIVFFM